MIPAATLRPRCSPGNPLPASVLSLTRSAGDRQSGTMRLPYLVVLLLLAAPAAAQRPGSPSDDAPAGPKRPYAGPQYPGKPPPLGASFAEPPRPQPAMPDRMPPAGVRPASSGSGFVVAPGRVLTNHHVVADCGSMVARNAAGTRSPARVLATDRRRDLALLAVPAEIGPPLTFRESPPVRRGETVVTYGFPLSGLATSGPTLTTGDLSALAGLRDNATNFQITAPVNPGNSGGPLFDSRGNVIGVVVSKLNALRTAEMTGGDIPQNVNFAIKGAEALDFLRDNGTQPRTAASTGPDRRNTDIDEIANPSTVYLQCYR